MKYIKKLLKIVIKVFLVWLLYVIVCVVIPPMFHKTAEYPAQSTSENKVREILESEATEHTEQNDLTAKTGEENAPERICSIEENEDALLWRLRLIAAAKERIVLTTFDFRDDNSGLDMMAALYDAADRGVQVQILVDGIYGALKLSDSVNFQTLDAHENVEIRFYNPINLLMPWKLNYRMHDKYLIADDWAYILGGRNTDDLFLGRYVETYNDDRDILVYETRPGMGSSYRRLDAYFEEIWNLPCNEAYAKCRIKKSGSSAERLRAHYQWLLQAYPDAFEETDWEKRTIETNGIELYTNPIVPENKEPLLWEKMLELMKQEEDILIQTPYIICSRKMYQDLTDLSDNGAGVKLVINAVESGTNPFGCTDYLNQKKQVQNTGADTYEYLGEQAAHTKSILVGDHISIVGSCNLDMRSIYLDTEMMLVIDSAELNASIRARAEAMMEQSRHVSSDGTVQDGEKYETTELSSGQKMFYSVLRVLIRPFRHLL